MDADVICDLPEAGDQVPEKSWMRIHVRTTAAETIRSEAEDLNLTLAQYIERLHGEHSERAESDLELRDVMNRMRAEIERLGAVVEEARAAQTATAKEKLDGNMEEKPKKTEEKHP